jgi:hypothetical protein
VIAAAFGRVFFPTQETRRKHSEVVQRLRQSEVSLIGPWLSGATGGTESSTGVADDYIATLRGRRINIFFMGQRGGDTDQPL